MILMKLISSVFLLQRLLRMLRMVRMPTFQPMDALTGKAKRLCYCKG
ncbi:unnamed protein product [Brassica napus]|uniref:(rape) hypothetical protein n=1 Tax=Brassica napus TaxID=3708 RepID=A0A817AVC4_BRANA|nr:unnamed protein product [Brassica napus]